MAVRRRRLRVVLDTNVLVGAFLSRDPFDNAFLTAAVAGRAHFLVTNDGDLLQVPIEAIRAYRFRIMTPSDFLRAARRFRR